MKRAQVPGSLALLGMYIFLAAVSSRLRAEPPSDKGGAASSSSAPAAQGTEESGLPGAGADYDPAIIARPIPAQDLAFLSQFAGQRSSDVLRDKQFRHLLKQIIPDVMFHYGTDKPLDSSLYEVMDHSAEPAVLHDNRYLVLSGANGPYLGGRGMLWIDMQDGLGLGVFYFHPTNGEPTPTVTVFGRQIRERAIGIDDLPLAFAEDLSVWAQAHHVPPITTRYFIGGLNRRILLEHDEDYCAAVAGFAPPPADVCQQMNADAADADMTTAYYLKQVNYATNATAWMIDNPDRVAWIGIRNTTCGLLLGCRIGLTRTEVFRVTGRPVPRPSPHPHPIAHR